MAESSLAAANYIVGFSPSVVSAVQDRTLVRVFRDAMFPRILYRGEAAPELWPVNLGANQTFTRTGLPRPSTRPLKQNQEPVPLAYDIEQWEATAQQYAGTMDTHMPTSAASLASLYLRNIHQLGLHSAQSLNRVVRDKLFNAYVAGNTVVKTGGVGAGTSVPVVSLNGFTRKLLNGRPSPVNAANPLQITIISAGVATNYNVTAYSPDTAGDEIHGGTLTIDVAHGGLSARDIVLASNRSQVINSGGSVSIDGIASSDQFTMADIRAAVSQLRTNNVPMHEDGKYHCHLDPVSESQIYGDNEFQRLSQGVPEYVYYKEFALSEILGTVFFRNTEAPTLSTVDQDPLYGYTFAAELQNTPSAGDAVEIHRPIFTGAGSVEEKFIDESRYISEAGVMGKIGEFAVSNDGVQVMSERVRLVLRQPLDRLQQQTSTSWSWSGDWTIPTDAGSRTSAADFKRAVVVQHGA